MKKGDTVLLLPRMQAGCHSETGGEPHLATWEHNNIGGCAIWRTSQDSRCVKELPSLKYHCTGRGDPLASEVHWGWIARTTHTAPVKAGFMAALDIHSLVHRCVCAVW